MKKIIIWVLVLGLLVGFLAPLFTSSSDSSTQAATFGFKENLATIVLSNLTNKVVTQRV
jgi:uncharacterized membrane protein YeaQ/YmgE (transglycosylase-associated protein family)